MDPAWVETEFSHANLGDQQHTARLMKIALARGLRPSVSLPQCFETEADWDGRYNFCRNPSVKQA